MYNTLIHALMNEFNLQKSFLGLKQVEFSPNFKYGNFPQTNKPCLVVCLPESVPSQFIGGFTRVEKTVILTVAFNNSKIDYNTASQSVIDREMNNYLILEKIEDIFNNEVFLSPLMNSLVENNEMHTTSRGYNDSGRLYKENLSLETYDINISIMLNKDQDYSGVSIEDFDLGVSILNADGTVSLPRKNKN